MPRIGASGDFISYPLLTQVDKGMNPVSPRTFIWHMQFMNEF
jgi:hypothetical protein